MFRNHKYTTGSKEPASSIAYRDLITGGLGLFILLFIMLIIHLGKEATESKDDITLPSGNMFVHIVWDEHINADVDLWVWNEKEKSPIGYSNKTGLTMDLLRDDLGHQSDPGKDNFEIVWSRGLPEGLWIINIHLYRSMEPVEVTISIEIKTEEGTTKKIFYGKVDLVNNGQEITVSQFTMGKNYTVTNKNNKQIHIRGAKDFGNFLERAGRTQQAP